MDKSDRLERIASALAERGVKFVIIGGWAVEAQGYEMGYKTDDIDFTPDLGQRTSTASPQRCMTSTPKSESTTKACRSTTQANRWAKLESNPTSRPSRTLRSAKSQQNEATTRACGCVRVFAQVSRRT